MKPNKKENTNKDVSKPAAPSPVEPMWRPTLKWHLKVLASVYAVLTVAYFAISAFLNRVPEPYHLREIPKEITPWMK